MAGGPKMGMNIGMGQIQTLRMTPQLQQAIKLLQMSRMEFETAIRQEVEENPILEEMQEGETSDPNEKVEATAEPVSEAASNQEPGTQNEQDPRQDDFEWDSYFDQPNKPPRDFAAGSDEIMNYENVISSTQTLYDYLIWQLNLFGFNEEEYQIASILVGYVDEDGYIKTPFETIAQEESVSVADLEEILPFIHEFDPPGVGARDLSECLLIQAKQLQEDTNDLVALVKNHLKDLEKKNYEGIAKAMGRELEEVVELCKIIYEMDPKPGRNYATTDTHYITPDVYVYKVGEEYVVSLNEDGLPRLRVSNFYKNALKGIKQDTTQVAAQQEDNKGTQDYIKDKLKSAIFLIKSIHQRQRTIYKVTESIVKHQREFFEKGPAFIKPMILRDIANDIGIHESTVSRVTSNKFVHTPRGIFELKYFFNSGINTTSGESLASESVKLKIRDLVAKEDVKNPLSDQRIVELLKVEGIQIARRTVAKYRDVLGILPSSRRKKFF